MGLKICVATDGGSIHSQRILQYLVNSGYQVHLVTYNQKVSKTEGVNVYRLPKFGKFKTIQYTVEMSKVIRKIKPDILHAHNVSEYGFYSSFSFHHPFILTAWGSDIIIAPTKSKVNLLKVKIALSAADVIIAVSHDLQHRIINFRVPRRKVKKIPFTADLHLFNLEKNNEIRNRLNWKNNFIVISNRSLEPIYNVETLIRAIPLIVKENRNIRFLILGDGSQRSQLQKLSKQLKVEKYVRFIGKVEYSDVPLYLKSSDIYVSTSLSDGASLSLLEAMACGLAPIISEIQPNLEWISNGYNGVTFPIKNEKILAKAILTLSYDSSLRNKFGEKSYEIVKRRGSWEKNMKKILDIYDELVS